MQILAATWKDLENPGIDPGTSHMLSERSTTWASPPTQHREKLTCNRFFNALLRNPYYVRKPTCARSKCRTRSIFGWNLHISKSYCCIACDLFKRGLIVFLWIWRESHHQTHLIHSSTEMLLLFLFWLLVQCNLCLSFRLWTDMKIEKLWRIEHKKYRWLALGAFAKKHHVSFSGTCGAMDNASDYGSEDSRFESWQVRFFLEANVSFVSILPGPTWLLGKLEALYYTTFRVESKPRPAKVQCNMIEPVQICLFMVIWVWRVLGSNPTWVSMILVVESRNSCSEVWQDEVFAASILR